MDGLAVHQLRVGAGVGEPGDLEREQATGGRVGGRVGERERDALVVEEPGAALLARGRPVDGLLEEPLHGAAAAGRDAEPLLDEPGPLQVVAGADARR